MTLDLLKGKILTTLTKLTIPIVLTAMMQMAYSLVDMIWIGKLGANSVAAVGVAGMFTWLSSGLVMMPRVGGQVKVGHALGRHDLKQARIYCSSAFQMAIAFAGIFGIVMITMSSFFIGLFHLNNVSTVKDAIIYLQVTCGLVIFSFLNQVITGLLNASGDSHTPFVANSIGLVLNLVFDPILIFGVGIFPRLNVLGAALATVGAQLFVFLLFIIMLKGKKALFQHLTLLQIHARKIYIDILKIGFPLALQSMLFSICSMIVARFVAGYGDGAVAAQKIGSQVEAISWNMADGFEASINSFIAQNYGAKQYQRVNKGYRVMMTIVLIWGLICTGLLIMIPGPIFKIFLDDPHVLPLGISYLTILGYSQLFMTAEITTSGAFSGLGNSVAPSFISIVLTTARIPMILILTQYIGLNGIWWAISLSSIFKGIISVSWFTLYKRKALA